MKMTAVAVFFYVDKLWLANRRKMGVQSRLNNLDSIF